MTKRLLLDPELTTTTLREMSAGELRDAFEYLVAHAATLDGYECGAARKGYITDFRYYTPTEHPYAFIVNQESLRFYFRSPAGMRSPAANVEVLKKHFAQVEVTSGGEIAVQILTLHDAMTLVHGAFGAGFDHGDDTPPLLTYPQLRAVAARMAAGFVHGRDDAPLMIARDLAEYPPGQAAALAVAMVEFLPSDYPSERFSKFLFAVAQGKVRSVFARHMEPE
jgi:hypothetical protein